MTDSPRDSVATAVPSARQHTVIAGAGLIGLTAAYRLLQAGHRVTLLESAAPGSGASRCNAGEFTPQQLDTHATGGMIAAALAGTLQPGSAVRISPQTLPTLGGFALSLARTAYTRKSRAASAALGQFTPGILPALDRLQQEGIDTAEQGRGFWMVSRSRDRLRLERRNYIERALKGYGTAPRTIAEPAVLAAAEPALAAAQLHGLFLPAERWINPETFVAALIARVTELGGRFLTGATVTRALRDRPGFVFVDEAGAKHTVTGDAALLATGAATGRVLRNSGLRHPPLVGGRGHSFTVTGASLPRHLITDTDRRVVFVPLAGVGLRAVSSLEIVGGNPGAFSRTSERQLRRIAQVGRELLPRFNWDQPRNVCAAARPITADGLPLFDFLPGRRHTLVCAGHGMFGLTLAPLCAEIITQLLAGAEPTVQGQRLNLRPFRLER